MHLSKRLRPLPALLGALLFAGATSSQAALLLVTTTNDSHDGQCTLH